MTTNWRSFESDISRFVAKAGRRADAIVRQSAMEIADRIVARTPVDTGFARASWFAVLNEEGGMPVNPSPPGAAGGGSNMALVLAGARAGDLITLANSASYIVKLEYGHSKQAPNGMVRVTAAEAAAIVAAVAQGLGP